ncbi:hypothetical protein EVG20_g8427 [Dentipellis fragilis]|uniref:Uncharacterized protein n=1 Tax=Dentipellis fragilis TaxID=205917 RepID=A0A4Y9Y6D0_9AGAM|nr:hypothetical protein EVG20_g8427 [Dentipellis fragilis]
MDSSRAPPLHSPPARTLQLLYLQDHEWRTYLPHYSTNGHSPHAQVKRRRTSFASLIRVVAVLVFELWKAASRLDSVDLCVYMRSSNTARTGTWASQMLCFPCPGMVTGSRHRDGECLQVHYNSFTLAHFAHAMKSILPAETPPVQTLHAFRSDMSAKAVQTQRPGPSVFTLQGSEVANGHFSF